MTIDWTDKDMEPFQHLALRRIRKLEPRARHVRGWQAMHRWWLDHAFADLLEVDSFQAPPDARALRENAWKSIVLSARKVVEIQALARPLVRRFERCRHLEPKFNGWCRSFVLVLWGSTSRFESELSSDFDLAIIADTDRPERCMEIISSLIVWPLKLALLDHRARRRFEGQRLRVDKFIRWIDHRALLEAPQDSDRYMDLACLLVWGRPLHDARRFKSYLASYGTDNGSLPRAQMSAALQDHIEDKFKSAERALANPGSAAREFPHHAYVFTRLCILSLALRFLDVSEWKLNFFSLAERLRRAGVLKDGDWQVTQRAVISALNVRNMWPVARVSLHEGVSALEDLRSLHRVTLKLTETIDESATEGTVMATT